MTRISYPVANGPKPSGPYSASVRIGNLIAIAGQVGFLPDGTLVEGLAAQTKRTIANIEAALVAAGATLDDVISTSVFLTDADDFAVFNEAYAPLFSEPYPARTTIYCGLRAGILVEISVLAALSDA